METRDSSSHDRERSDSSPLHSPSSPTRALKRLVKSVSKNALKLASTLSPRKHVLGFSRFSPNSPPPKSPLLEANPGGAALERELRAVFRYFDADGDGKISWQELQRALNSVGEEVGENELRETIKELDSDGDGCIDVHEFIRLNTQERGSEGEEKELAAAFRMFEGREGGGITPVGLQRMMCRLGVGDDALTLDHCSFIISQIDMDGDGVLSFHEFKHMMMITAVH
ncbi:probable calcium-binding protein CML18 [Cryptomeria japonica]|uniref:probable calcium-binding protein CML18 n=1 Tax=Cryptomeria japonica TaxID=3369 RepID=UPI0025AD0B1C|nr:probable calcium-binding protein CML18 [Cryptomeria japonica]